MEKRVQSNFEQSETDTAGGHLRLKVNPRLIPLFFQLLGQGFRVNVQTGATVKDLLCRQLGIGPDYLAQRIQSIFLKAKVVDNIDSAEVADGSTLALSGAMPGLVGAILRSGGYYAAMRNQLSHVQHEHLSQRQGSKITLKLMNIVAKELGPIFLQQGIRLHGQALGEFLTRRADDLKAGCRACELDGKSVEFTGLLGIDWREGMVLLQVYPEAKD